MRTTQIAVIGGGPAGLQAAMSIGRVHRQAILFDSGEYRNGSVEHMHNVIGFDGTPPAEFRRLARAQVGDYSTVDVRTDAVTGLRRSEQGFEIAADGGDVLAQAVILATGMRDVLPAIRGIEHLWGTRVGQCPFCHGHEYANRRIGILGAAVAGHYIDMMLPITQQLTVLTHGEDLTPEVAAVVAAADADVRPSQVTALEPEGDGVRVQFAEGESVDLAGVFLLPGMQQRAPFAHSLGLVMQDSGAVRVDEARQSSLPGVFVAGDMGHSDAFGVPMASVVQSMASGQLAAISAIQWLMRN